MGSPAVPQGVIHTGCERSLSRVVAGLWIEPCSVAANDQRRPAESKSGGPGQTDRMSGSRPMESRVGRTKQRMLSGFFRSTPTLAALLCCGLHWTFDGHADAMQDTARMVSGSWLESCRYRRTRSG